LKTPLTFFEKIQILVMPGKSDITLPLELATSVPISLGNLLILFLINKNNKLKYHEENPWSSLNKAEQPLATVFVTRLQILSHKLTQNTPCLGKYCCQLQQHYRSIQLRIISFNFSTDNPFVMIASHSSILEFPLRKTGVITFPCDLIPDRCIG